MESGLSHERPRLQVTTRFRVSEGLAWQLSSQESQNAIQAMGNTYKSGAECGVGIFSGSGRSRQKFGHGPRWKNGL